MHPTFEEWKFDAETNSLYVFLVALLMGNICSTVCVVIYNVIPQYYLYYFCFCINVFEWISRVSWCKLIHKMQWWIKLKYK